MRKVEAILLELVLSFPPDLRVRNMPPRFSGLGVLEPLRAEVVGWAIIGGDKVEPKVAVLCCGGDVIFLSASFPELVLVLYDGRFGRFLAGSCGGLTRSW